MKPTVEQMRTAVAAKKKAKPAKASEALGKHEGKTLMVTQTDRTKVGGGYLGGPGFSGIQHDDPRYENMAWGVAHPAIASVILGANRRVPENEAIWSTLIGDPEQHTSNQMVFDALVRDFKRASKAGLLTPELRERMNARLAVAADREGVPLFGQGADILDPALIKMADTFAKRKAIAALIGGQQVGGKKGQIGNYDKLVRSTTDPMVQDVPTHSIGPRLFQLSGEKSNRPDLHPAFPHLLHGQDLGQTYEPVPKEIMLRDYIRSFLEDKKRMPKYLELTRGYGPMQHLSEEFLTHLQKHGYADGGSVEPSQDEMLAHITMNKAPGAVNIKQVGVNEAPDMPIKLFVPPSDGAGQGLPIGGVDFQPMQPGRQMLPAQPGQLGQPPMGQPPMGQPGQPPMPPQRPTTPLNGPQSNILSLTPQGQAMQAMRPNPMPMPRPPMLPMGRPPMARMKRGGSTHDIQIEERVL